MVLRDWSLIRGGGRGLQNGRGGGGASEVLPSRKEGEGLGKVLAMLMGRVLDLRFSHFVAPLPIIKGKLAHNVYNNTFIRNYHSVFFEG